MFDALCGIQGHMSSVTSNGTVTAWERGRGSWEHENMPVAHCRQHSASGEWGPVHPGRGHMVLVYMARATHCLLGGQHGIDAIAHCSLRRDYLVIDLLGAEIDLWSLWKSNIRTFWVNSTSQRWVDFEAKKDKRHFGLNYLARVEMLEQSLNVTLLIFTG